MRPRDRAWDTFFQGKVFPRLRKRSPQGSAESTSSDKEDDEATDYVFRIIYAGMQSEFGKTPWPRAPGIHLGADPGNNSRYLELEDERSGASRGVPGIRKLVSWRPRFPPNENKQPLST